MSARKASAPLDRRTLYGCIPKAICADPCTLDLTAFELAIMATLIALARQGNVQSIHDEGLKRGRAAIELENELKEQFHDEWRRYHAGASNQPPKRFHAHEISRGTQGRLKPIKPRRAFRRAGEDGYAKGVAAVRQKALPNTLKLETTRSKILRAARLTPSTAKRMQLDAALTRLARLDNLQGEEMPAFINVRMMSDDRMIVKISGIWASEPYNRIPLPLPVKSPLATNLLLYLCHIRPGPQSVETSDVSFLRLCERFGLEQVPWIARQSIDRALLHINERYLPLLDRDTLHDLGIKMPAVYNLMPIDDGRRLRFVADHTGPTLKPRPKGRVSLPRARIKHSQTAAEKEADEWEFRRLLHEREIDPDVDLESLDEEGAAQYSHLRQQFERGELT